MARFSTSNCTISAPIASVAAAFQASFDRVPSQGWARVLGLTNAWQLPGDDAAVILEPGSDANTTNVTFAATADADAFQVFEFVTGRWLQYIAQQAGGELTMDRAVELAAPDESLRSASAPTWTIAD